MVRIHLPPARSQTNFLVTLCVQDILRGRRIERTISPSDWGHTICAALSHDIGYVRGICAGDNGRALRDQCRRDNNQPPAPKYLNDRDNFPIVPIDDQAHAHDGDNR
jgi:hypothetical protein